MQACDTGCSRGSQDPGRISASLAPKVAVFVDGCFWHGCPEHYSRAARTTLPSGNEKLRKNQARDLRDGRRLEAAGWSVASGYWECEVKDTAARIVEEVRQRVRGAQPLRSGR